MKITSFLLVGSLALYSAAVQSAPAANSKAAPKNAAPKVTPKTVGIWQPATSAQRTAAAASIRAQLEAFKRDDWAKAATYQSEGLRHNFGTVAQFRAIIETNYPQFAKYKSVAFAQARALGDIVQIQVQLVGKDGVKLRAIYLMKKEKGVYRIEGVQGGNAAGKASPLPRNPADYV